MPRLALCPTILAALAAQLVLAHGCATNDLDWNVEFESDALKDQTARLDVEILRGECPGTEVVWAETIHPGRPSTTPPKLSGGTYCLWAEAGNMACEWIGGGEVTVMLPTAERIVVTVFPVMPVESNCAMEMCQSDGTCATPVVDPTMMTCADGGCSQVCTSDCRATCAGGGCDQTCQGGAAVDCDFECSGGSCLVLCEDGADCTATCADGSCNMTCGAGVSDCIFDCSGGSCTFECDDLMDCDVTCGGGLCAGP